MNGTQGDACTLLTEAEGSLELPGCPDWIIPNADGAGYYRWSMARDDLNKLRTTGYSQLGVHERISFAHSLRAGVDAGTLPIAEALEAFASIAHDPEGEVVDETIATITFTRERLLPESERGRVDEYVQKLFTPIFKRLGFSAKKDESTSARRLRHDVIELLTRSRSPEVLKEAVKRGRAYAGLNDGKFHPEAVDPDLAQLVLSVAVEEGDAAIFDAMVKRLERPDDADLRGRILAALGSVHDPERVSKALALSLDPKLRKQEGMRELFLLSRDRRTREAAWSFVQANLEAIAAKIPDNHVAFLPYVAGEFCDHAHAEQAEAFFGPRASRYSGMPKNVRQVVEMVHLCAAKVEAHRDGAMKFFSNPTRVTP